MAADVHWSVAPWQCPSCPAGTEAALRTGNYGPLDRYLQSWYEHTIRLATDPAWARQWDELRRNPPPRPDPSAALPLEEAIARLGESG